MTKNQDHTGFTLIEMLVAMTMIVTIVSMVYGSYAATSRSREVYSSRLTCSERANLVLRLMSRQIRCAYGPPNDPNTTESAARAGRPPVEKPADVFYGHDKGPRGEILRFVTTAGLGSTLHTQRGLSYIRYQYDPAAGTLSINYGPHEKRRDANNDRLSWRPILEGIVDVEVEFHDGRQWQSQWRDRRTQTLPRAVKIGLTLIDNSGREHQFSTAVPIVCRTRTAASVSRPRTEAIR